MFDILLSRAASKFLDKCEKGLHKRLMTKIEALANDPYPNDTKRVIGTIEKTFRVRVGDYRVLYVVFDEKEEILIADIDKRERIYG